MCLFHPFIINGYGFLSRGFTDRREILRGGSATSRTGLIPFWGDSPRDGRVLGVNRGHMAAMLLAEALVWSLVDLCRSTFVSVTISLCVFNSFCIHVSISLCALSTISTIIIIIIIIIINFFYSSAFLF